MKSEHLNSSQAPLVSVALATYNGERFLPEFLRSLDRQTLNNFEIVASDDNSSDSTVQVLRDFELKLPIKRLNHSERLGVTGNFSRAIAACSGLYIALADQDDCWSENKLGVLVERMRVLEGAWGEATPILVFSDINVVGADLSPLGGSFFSFGKKSNQCGRLADFLLSNHIPGCAMLVNRALIKKSLPIPSAACMHDWWLAMVASAFGIVDYVDEQLIKYRQHGKNAVGADPSRNSILRRVRNNLFVDSQEFAAVLARRKAYAQKIRANARIFGDIYWHELKDDSKRSLELFLLAGQSPWGRLRFMLGARLGEPFVRAWNTLSLV